jgi:hypothetical protein
MSDKKKFKDTAVGKFLIGKLPELANAALTGGPLEALRTIIDSDGSIGQRRKKGSTMSL